MKTSVIIPTIGRPDKRQVPACVIRCLETAKSNDVEVIVVLDGNTKLIDDLKYLKIKCIARKEHRGPIYSWNEGATYAEGSILVLGADDIYWHDNWYAELESAFMQPDVGVVGLNDLHRGPTEFATHFAATRQFCVDVLGGIFVPPVYSNYFVDVEIWMRAVKLGQYARAEKAIAEHRHYFYCKELYDSVYQLGQQHYKTDEAIFQDRLARGFPNDWEPILTQEVAQ